MNINKFYLNLEMDCKEVISELEKLGNDKTRQYYAKKGAFGLMKW